MHGPTRIHRHAPTDSGLGDVGMDRAPDDPHRGEIGESVKTWSPQPVLERRLSNHRYTSAEQKMQHVKERGECSLAQRIAGTWHEARTGMGHASLSSSRQIAGQPRADAMAWASVVLPEQADPLTTMRVGDVTAYLDTRARARTSLGSKFDGSRCCLSERWWVDHPPTPKRPLIAAPGPIRVQRDGVALHLVDELRGGQLGRLGQQRGHDRLGVFVGQAAGPRAEHPHPGLVEHTRGEGLLHLGQPSHQLRLNTNAARPSSAANSPGRLTSAGDGIGSSLARCDASPRR